MRYFKSINFNSPYPTQVMIGEFDPDNEEMKDSENSLYCPVWEWQEDSDDDDVIPGSQNHDWVSIPYDFENDKIQAEEISEDEFYRLYFKFDYPCNTDCARYCQGDCPFNPLTKEKECPRFRHPQI